MKIYFKINQMKFLSIIIVLELILSSIFLAAPSLKNHFLNKQPSVLGTKDLAQDNASPTDTPTDTPTDQSSPIDTSTPQDTSVPIDASSPTDTSSPIDTSLETATPEESATPIVTEIPNTEAPTESPTETPIETSSESANITETSPLSDQTLSALDSSSITTDTTGIDQNVVQQVQDQNQQVSQATTPETQVQTSVNAGQTDIQTINSSLTTTSLANINLATQDLSQHVDNSLTALNQTSSDQKPVLKQAVTNFCTNTDISLRSAEEMVLEESEQDMEIVRAKCINVLNQQ